MREKLSSLSLVLKIPSPPKHLLLRRYLLFRRGGRWQHRHVGTQNFTVSETNYIFQNPFSPLFKSPNSFHKQSTNKPRSENEVSKEQNTKRERIYLFISASDSSFPLWLRSVWSLIHASKTAYRSAMKSTLLLFAIWNS